jgi:hypothetical protein
MEIKKRLIIDIVLSLLFLLMFSCFSFGICQEEFLSYLPTCAPPPMYDSGWYMTCDEGNLGRIVQIYGVEGYSCDQIGYSECRLPCETVHICENGVNDDGDTFTDCEEWCDGSGGSDAYSLEITGAHASPEYDQNRVRFEAMVYTDSPMGVAEVTLLLSTSPFPSGQECFTCQSFPITAQTSGQEGGLYYYHRTRSYFTQ